MKQSKQHNFIAKTLAEKSNQIVQLNEGLALARYDIETLKDTVSVSSNSINSLRCDSNDLIHCQTSINERLENIEKKLDVLCSHFSFLFTQLDQQQV